MNFGGVPEHKSVPNSTISISEGNESDKSLPYKKDAEAGLKILRDSLAKIQATSQRYTMGEKIIDEKKANEIIDQIIEDVEGELVQKFGRRVLKGEPLYKYEDVGTSRKELESIRKFFKDSDYSSRN